MGRRNYAIEGSLSFFAFGRRGCLRMQAEETCHASLRYLWQLGNPKEEMGWRRCNEETEGRLRVTTKYVKGELDIRGFSKGGLRVDHVIELITITIVSDEKIVDNNKLQQLFNPIQWLINFLYGRL
jgi:hypothetical protein